MSAVSLGLFLRFTTNTEIIITIVLFLIKTKL